MSYILKTIDDEIKMCELRANYWMAMATTGVGRKRSLSHGTVGPEFADEEKDADCMSIAKNHIEIMSKIIEEKSTLMCEQRKSVGRNSTREFMGDRG
jgi:hypothetical protein